MSYPHGGSLGQNITSVVLSFEGFLCFSSLSLGLVKDTHVTHSALLCPVGFEESRRKRDLAT
jgi:hypothetical protein